MRFRKSRDEEPTIGIAPFVDMVFLLLIFFMVTAQFNVISGGIPIQLPKVSGKTFDDQREKVVLMIDREGRMSLRGTRLDMNGLNRELRAILKEKGLVSLVIQADRSVPHGAVVEVMDAAKTAGVSSIVIAAEWKSSRGSRN